MNARSVRYRYEFPSPSGAFARITSEEWDHWIDFWHEDVNEEYAVKRLCEDLCRKGLA